MAITVMCFNQLLLLIYACMATVLFCCHAYQYECHCSVYEYNLQYLVSFLHSSESVVPETQSVPETQHPVPTPTVIDLTDDDGFQLVTSQRFK